MSAREYHQEAQEEELAEFQDPLNRGGGGGGGKEDDEEEEILSLCDLPIYGDEAAEYRERDDSSLRKSQGSYSSSCCSSSSSSSSDGEFFEFSSPRRAKEPENIMFCGKLIPYNKGLSSGPRKGQALNGVGAPLDKYIKSARKVTGDKLSSSSRWHLLLFGSAKFPGHVEMRDLKKRQNKTRRFNPAPCEPKTYSWVGGEAVKGDLVKGKRWWALLSATGCMNQTANSMVKTSINCAPKI